MSKYTGRQIHFGVGVESTHGTKATSKTWIPKTNFSFDDKIGTKEDESSLGGKIDISGIEVVREMGEGNIEMKASANNIGYFLYSILGKKQTSTVTASKVFSHLFTINDDTENPSLTIFTKEPNGDFTYPLAIILAFLKKVINMSFTLENLKNLGIWNGQRPNDKVTGYEFTLMLNKTIELFGN